MKEKMTSGEIAKQAGVSTKALRVYLSLQPFSFFANILEDV